MLILGLTKTTLLDYPQHVAATVFTGGCNFRCPYCHNGEFVLNPASEPKIDEEEVFNHLTKRRNILEGVCITGGEPTIHADLPIFIKKIKDMGYLIKLDTNGTNPKMLKELIEDKYIDYVAMDLKNSFEKYSETTGCSDKMLEKVKESVSILLSGAIDHEFRTTITKELHSEADIKEMSRILKGEKRYYLQGYIESENVIEKRFTAYSRKELEEMTKRIKESDEGFPPMELRGID